MIRRNKNPVYVTAEFQKATIDMIKQILRSNKITYRNNNEKYRTTYNIQNTDISVDFDFSEDLKRVTGHLYIGSDSIFYAREEAQALYDAFYARRSEQTKRKAVVAKEAELTAKLQQYIGNTK